MPHYQPPDASQVPRYAGVRTFARLPHLQVPAPDVDAAVVGVPFDTATSFRPGARFGPEGIRSASALLRPYHPPLDVDVFGTLSLVDGGDLAVTPGNALKTVEQIDGGLRPLLQAGIVPLVLGGDHSIAMGTLGGMARARGAGAALWIDAHGDLNRPTTSPSGNVHGMPLAAALGAAGDAFRSDVYPTPSITRAALIGVRSLDPGERELIGEADVLVFRDIVKEKLPRLTQHFAKFNYDVNMPVLQWFLCLFVGYLPSEVRLFRFAASFCSFSDDPCRPCCA